MVGLQCLLPAPRCKIYFNSYCILLKKNLKNVKNKIVPQCALFRKLKTFKNVIGRPYYKTSATFIILLT